MGLAGPKNKRKLGNDPNNTKWSRNTDSFGHRMLRSQGWKPGQYLGPQNSAHAAFHTAASASHIRVALKDDNLGLGAKLNRGDECTGLNAFKEMLARLNGKSEAAIEKDKLAREDHMRSVYIERKFGSVRFVSGGFLVGDKIEVSKMKKSKAEGEEAGETAETSSASSSSSEEMAKKEKKSKKRKAEEADDDANTKEARRKEKRRRREEADASGEGEVDSSRAEAKSKRKKEKKENSDRKKRKEEGATSDEKDPADKKNHEKKKKKEKKKREAEKQRKGSEKPTKDSDDEATRESTAAPTTGTSTPVDSGTSTPVPRMSGRHLARRRFIAQKRMALNDQQALNQIFMIKSS